MSWNGSGTVTISDGVRSGTPCTQQQAASVSPTGALMDTIFNGLADDVEACLNRNGENKMAVNLDMNSKKIITMADGMAAQDAATVVQLQKGGIWYLGSVTQADVNVIVADASPALSSYANGTIVIFTAAATTTSDASLNVNGKGAATLNHLSGVPVKGGGIIASATYVAVYYNGWNVLNPSPNIAHVWAPTLTASGSMTFGSTNIYTAVFSQHGKMIEFIFDVSGVVGGSLDYTLNFEAPVTAVAAGEEVFSARSNNGTVTNGCSAAYLSTTDIIAVTADKSSTAGKWEAGPARYRVSGRYRAA